MTNAVKTHFVFDVDDTLTDSQAFNQQMFVDTFAPHLDLDHPPTQKYLRHLHSTSRGTSMLTQFEQAIKHFSLNLNASSLVSANEEIHIKNVDNIKLFNSVTDVIKTIKSQGKQVSVCTNRQTASLTRILKNHGLYKYCTHVVSCADAGHEKPDPFCLLELVAKSGRPKKEFIYLGDSPTDSQFAKNAGIDSLIIDHYLNQKMFYQLVAQSLL